MSVIELREVSDRKTREDFLRFPYRAFRKYPSFVGAPDIFVKDALVKEKNPYFKDGEMVLLVAYRDGKPAGRVLFGYSGSFIERLKKREGVFSLFDFVEDYNVFCAIADRMREYFKKWDISLVRGPLPPDGEDNFRGVLTKGFEYSPYFLTSWNPPYYLDFYRRYGFESYNTLFALRLEQERVFSERLKALADKTRKRYGISIRPVNLRDKGREVKIIKRIVDETFTEELVEDWEDFLPPDEEGIRFLIRSLGFVADRDIVLLAFVRDEPAGFVVGLPDYNRLFVGLDGRTTPKLLFRLLFGKRKINRARILIFGVSYKHRNKGVDLNLMLKLAENALKRGYMEAEGSTIGEENYPMWRAVAHIGGKIYKEYQFFKIPVKFPVK